MPADHPSLPGHFPGNPVVPGVVLLDAVLSALPGAALLTAKFTAPVTPGVEVAMQTAPDGPNRLAFTCTAGGRTVLRGTVRTP